MSSKEIKTLLKDAREAIKSKDFKSAVIKCKEILKQDKTNYMAHVMLGACYQETDKKEAAKYLRSAVKYTNEPPTIALQGLSLCAEPEELPEIYGKLLNLTPDKYEDIHGKLLNVAVTSINLATDVSPFVHIFENESKCENAPQRQSSALNCLANLFIQNAGCSRNDNWQPMFLNALKHVCCDDKFIPDKRLEMYKAYLKLLYKLNEITELIKQSARMFTFYPREIYPLEWICKLYVENDSSELNVQSNLDIDIGIYAEQLILLSPQSKFGLMTKAITCYENQNYIEARDTLIKVLNLQVDWNICLKWLVKIYEIFHAYSLCELYNRLQKPIDGLSLVKCLIEQKMDKRKNDEAILICKSLLPTAEFNLQPEIIYYLTRALLNNGQFDAAKKTIDKLNEITGGGGGGDMSESEKVIELLAINEQYQGNNIEAMNILLKNSNNNNNSNYYLQIGQINFDLNKPRDALDSFLRATKLEPFNSDCFYWLGRVYDKQSDRNKAIKCYEKCVQLNAQHEQGVCRLSAIYREMENMQSNGGILQMALTVVPDCIASVLSIPKWVYIQKGFHNLVENNYNEAVAAFRNALRSDGNDVACLEGLADAYLQRGSLTSALRVYEKISEIKPNNPYPKLQVANVKTTLHLHKEAIECYENLLIEQPDFVPALKGIAEAHLGLTYFNLSRRLLGRAKVHSEEAIKYLTNAVQLNSNFGVLWRLLANAFESIACQPKSSAHTRIIGALANVKSEYAFLEGDKLFDLAASCYCRAIKILPKDPLIWYELSLSYYLRANRYGKNHKQEENNEYTKKYLQLSTTTIKHTIKLLPTRSMSWNLLGVISATKTINNLQLAQHCFIKAIDLNKKSSIAWTNLGVLYLSQNYIKLANRAFGRAQQSDTSYVNCWTGQAMIAELIGESVEAMDLFKHCTTLQYTGESAVGFTHWVCTVLNDQKLLNDSKFRYFIENMYAVPSALDSIEWFCRAEDVDTSLESVCFMGYLYYQRFLWSNAIKAFKKATELADGIIKDKMYCNLGYCYLKNDQPLEALMAFHSVTEATFTSTIGMAFAHFKAKQYEESYSVYESALQWLATNDAEKSMILVAMSAMVYTFQGEKDAKSLLFQCIGLPEPPIEGLFSACAVGIIHNDDQLTELVLKELKKHENNQKYLHHIAFLTSQFYLKNNDVKSATNYLLSKVHCSPANLELRKVLSNFILKNCRGMDKLLIGASRIAESTIVLQLKDLKCKNSSIEAAKSLAMASQAMQCVNKKEQLKFAQRAVHLNPSCKEAWGALISCTN